MINPFALFLRALRDPRAFSRVTSRPPRGTRPFPTGPEQRPRRLVRSVQRYRAVRGH